MTEFTMQALARLRDTGNFQWYVIPLLVIRFLRLHRGSGKTKLEHHPGRTGILGCRLAERDH